MMSRSTLSDDAKLMRTGDLLPRSKIDGFINIGKCAADDDMNCQNAAHLKPQL